MNYPGIDGKPFKIVLDRQAFDNNDVIVMDKSHIYYQVKKTRFFWLKKFLVRWGFMNPSVLSTYKATVNKR